MALRYKILVLDVVMVCSLMTSRVVGHGYLLFPPSRNSLWRHGYKKAPKNYNDNGLNCGGFANQWEKNGGKCGVCGDPYQDPNQDHVHGGRFVTDIIPVSYIQGQVVDVTIVLTANHKGWFQFRVGDIGTPPITQEKLDKHVMKIISSKGDELKYRISDQKSWTTFHLQVQLPPNLTCQHCVLQWWYNTGNHYGCNNDKKCGVGAGKQETFINCADIKIMPQITDQGLPTPKISPSMSTKSHTVVPQTKKAIPRTGRKTITSQITTDRTPKDGTILTCRAAGPWTGDERMRHWCNVNCNHVPPFCPLTHCRCT